MRHARLIALPLMLALAACQQQQAKQDEPAAVPEAKPGMELGDGRLVLNAVKGNPAAAYFTLVNNSGMAAELVAVHIDGVGKAELHCPCGEHGTMLPVLIVVVGYKGAPEIRQEFQPGGHHVMAFDVDPKLAPGGKTEMTLTFADGDKLSAALAIESAGAAAMGGMEH